MTKDYSLRVGKILIRNNNDYSGGDRVFVDFRGKKRDIDAFEALPIRQRLATMREYALPTLARMLNVPDAKFSFSTNAGCKMCPCSPGFIMKGIENGNNIFVEIHID